MTVIGIANSVELFKGEYTSKSNLSQQFLCGNEQKIIFSPYTKDQVVFILKKMLHISAVEHGKTGCREKLQGLIEDKALSLVAMKVEKMSGDLRTAFTIMQNAISNRLKLIDELESNIEDSAVVVKMDDVNKVLLDMYSSKTVQIIKQLPRSHSMLLCVLESTFSAKDLA